jgi:hypothetical protein
LQIAKFQLQIEEGRDQDTGLVGFGSGLFQFAFCILQFAIVNLFCLQSFRDARFSSLSNASTSGSSLGM